MRIRCPQCREVSDVERPDDGFADCPDCRHAAAVFSANVPQVIQLFDRIESGSVTLTPDVELTDVFCENVACRASTGHRITLFRRHDSWRYIDSVYAPDGALLWAYPTGLFRSAQRDQLADYDLTNIRTGPAKMT